MDSRSTQRRAAARGSQPPGGRGGILDGLGRWLPLLAAAGVGLLLVGSALYSRATMLGAAATATRGQGEVLSMAVRNAWNRRRGEDRQAVLEAILAELRASGLRHVAVTGPGQGGPLEAAAGAALGSSRPLGEVIDLGQRVRLVNPLFRQPGRGQGGLKLHRAKGPPPHFMKGAHPPPPPPPKSLILEYEPLTARELVRQANTQLAVAGGAAVVVLLLGLVLTRLLGQREALQVQLEEERRLAALGEMSAVLAHELRNPLTSLKGHAQLLLEQLEEGSRPRDKAGRVVNEAVRLERLINDLLTFVRSGELQLAPTPPRALLRQVIDELDDERLDFDGSDGEEDPPWPMDRERMRQVLVNILQNALQASPAEGRVRAGVSVAGGRLSFVVEDGGPGVPKEDLDQIFEPFYTGRVRGTGLGLAITRRIVEQHGGAVLAENLPAPATGARLTITIPRAAGGEQE